MNLSLRFSPCPNDTFIFEALVNRRVTDESLHFEIQLADIEQLNHWAISGEPDICKVSAGVLPFIAEEYQVIDSGSALGYGCGPLLVARADLPWDLRMKEELSVAIPGLYTTANLLLSIVYPEIQKKSEIVFSKIEDSVVEGRTDLGLIIHENRFTYESRGLKKIIDLGEYWEKRFSLPLPLGCIAVRRSLPDNIKHIISRLIGESTRYALANPFQVMAFVSKYAQTMDQYVMLKHINLYVNRLTVSMGKEGKDAIRKLLSSECFGRFNRQDFESLFLDQ